MKQAIYILRYAIANMIQMYQLMLHVNQIYKGCVRKTFNWGFFCVLPIILQGFYWKNQWTCRKSNKTINTYS